MPALNPIVRLYFYLMLSFAFILSDSLISISILSIVTISIAVKNRHHIPKVISAYLPTVFFFPMVLVMYVIFSQLLSDLSIMDSIKSATKAFSRFSLMIISMNFYLVNSSSERLIDAFRSVWVKFGLTWKWVDDIFIFLSLSLRFYPSFQSQWKKQRESQKGLGIKFKDTFLSKLVDVSISLPIMLTQQLNRSEDIALAMKLRGYGKNFPRKVAYSIDFNFVHFIQMLSTAYFFYSLIRFV